MKARIRFTGSMESHFWAMVALTVFFFCVDQATDALVAFGMTSVKIGGEGASTAFHTLMGIAVGIFRGMSAQGESDPGPSETNS